MGPDTGPVWFIMFGAFVSMLGMLAAGSVLAAAKASTGYLGLMAVAAGSLQIAHAFSIRPWPPFASWFMGGLLYLMAGGCIVLNPRLVAPTLGFVLAIALVAVSVARVVFSFEVRPSHRSVWVGMTALIPAALGALMLIGWPQDKVFALQLLMTADLVTQGLVAIALGLSLRKIPSAGLFEL